MNFYKCTESIVIIKSFRIFQGLNTHERIKIRKNVKDKNAGIIVKIILQSKSFLLFQSINWNKQKVLEGKPLNVKVSKSLLHLGGLV